MFTVILFWNAEERKVAALNVLPQRRRDAEAMQRRIWIGSESYIISGNGVAALLFKPQTCAEFIEVGAETQRLIGTIVDL
jgi:hypothetical protein